MTVLFGRGGAAPLAGDDAGLSRRLAAWQKGMRYPADPPIVDEIVAVMRHAADDRTAGACER
jgi:hypothetical protein